jgi:hypothetical protein
MGRPANASMVRWQPTDPRRASSLSDTRLQLHHAAQFATALGISYLRKQPDDSHTNLGWNHGLGALVSREVEGKAGVLALGVRVEDLTLLVIRDKRAIEEVPLNGATNASATAVIRRVLASERLDPDRFTLARHYDLPMHAVASGSAYDVYNDVAFRELAVWLGNASIELERVACTVTGASDVRLWPHHFDIATLVAVGAGGSTGAGLVLGDSYYDEPYFYVNVHPQPSIAQLTDPLSGGGTWHTREWIGAVLPGSRVVGGAVAQQAQAREYLDVSLAACRKLITK